jgi:PhnB protein
MNNQRGLAVLLGIDDPVDAERIFHALAESRTVQMPLQKTFWSVRFGVLIDQFGIPWAINLRASAQRSVDRKGLKENAARLTR